MKKNFINISTWNDVINLSCELDVAEASEKLFDCVVRDGVRSAQVGEGLVLDRNQKIPEVRQLNIKLKFQRLHAENPPELICQEGPHSSDILLPVSGVDCHQGLDVPDGVELGGNDVRGKGKKVALVQTYPPVVGLKENVLECGQGRNFAQTHCEKGPIHPLDWTPRVFNVVFTEELCACLQY